MSFVESLYYIHVDVEVGRSVKLSCNTSLTSDTMWSYDNNDDGYVDYVYWNGRIDKDKPQLSIKPTEAHHHILVISDAVPTDTGLYNCYDGKGTRKVGYQLIIAGMRSSCIR